MPTFILLTRRAVVQVSDRTPAEGINLDDTRRRAGIGWWLSDSVTSGGWDHVNIFEAPNAAAALLIANRIESVSGARTELWPVGDACVNLAGRGEIPVTAPKKSPARSYGRMFGGCLAAARDAIALAFSSPPRSANPAPLKN